MPAYISPYFESALDYSYRDKGEHYRAVEVSAIAPGKHSSTMGPLSQCNNERPLAALRESLQVYLQLDVD
jgi:hypothetical protein